MSTLPLSAITVPPDRQRKDLGDVSGLANSIKTVGLLSPIIVRAVGEGFELVAGERRFRAVTSLNWRTIPAIEMSELDDQQRTLVELEENIRRKQLSWPEEVSAVAKYVAVCGDKAHFKIAADLGINENTLSRMLAVADAISSGDKQLLEQRNWTAALNVLMARTSRKMDKMLEDIKEEDPLEGLVSDEGDAAGEEEGTEKAVVSLALPRQAPAVPAATRPDHYFNAACADFRSWAPEYAGPRFNLIHCDFPYGLNMDKEALQNSSARWEAEGHRYDDSPELFWELLTKLLAHQEKLVADAAHCLFWLAPRNLTTAAEKFKAAGWTVFDTPLVWHKSDNAGIASNVRMWPRRTYEMALFAVRGNRQILKPKAASFVAPTTKDFHLSEKPTAVLRHFFEMLVDSSTTMLDPTCGGGTACQVALEFGASKVLGLDTNEECVRETLRKLSKVGEG